MRGSMTHLQVLHALLLRETRTRFGANYLGYFWALVQPAAWIGMFWAFYGVFGRMSPAGTSVLAFLTTGIGPFSSFRETTYRCMSAIESNKGLLFYAQVKPLDLVLARAVLETATHVVVIALLLGGVALYEGPPQINSMLDVLLGIGLASTLGAALGLVCCSLNAFSPTVERIFPTMMRLFFWTSAMFHPVESVPKTGREVLLLNPVAHAIELVRVGWLPGYSSPHINPWYPVAWILVLVFFGLSLERMARRHLELA